MVIEAADFGIEVSVENETVSRDGSCKDHCHSQLITITIDRRSKVP